VSVRTSRSRLLRVPHLTSVSLEEAHETEYDSGSKDPAHNDEEHTPPLRGTVRHPGITQVEASDKKEESTCSLSVRAEVKRNTTVIRVRDMVLATRSCCEACNTFGS
jgi:hypothetical protein